MTNQEMLSAFERGGLVQFRGGRYRIIGIEFGRPGGPEMIFSLLHSAILLGRDQPVEDATAAECEFIEVPLVPARRAS